MAPDPEPQPAARRAHPNALVLGRPADAASGPLRLPASGCVVLLPDVAAPAGGPGAALLALVALWLARDGLAVLVHRPGAAGRGDSAAAVLESLGVMLAAGADDVADRWARREPAAVASERLGDGPPAVASAWRLAAPAGPRHLLRVVPCDDGDQGADIAGWAVRSGEATVCVGGLGDLRQHPQVDVWIDGRLRPELGAPARDEPPGRWALLPRDRDATRAALFVQAVLSGERPMPEPLLRVVGAVQRACTAACR